MIGFKNSESQASDLDELLEALEKLTISLNFTHRFPRLPSPLPCQFTGTENTVADFERLLQALHYNCLESQWASLAEPVEDPKYPSDDFWQVAEIDLKPGEVHRIIFLDFDGVVWVDADSEERPRPNARLEALCNNLEISQFLDGHWEKLVKHCNFNQQKEFFKLTCWDPQHMQRLRSLCQECDARIVVTSNWRHHRRIRHLKNLLDLWGLGHYVIGRTMGGYSRAAEIMLWIKQNKHINGSFVVLDDCYIESLRVNFADNFQQCDPDKGFDEVIFENAKKILLNPKMTLESIRQAQVDKETAKQRLVPKLSIEDIMRLKPN